mmetsp:Transcript_15112/g.49569  ORF Transcript_15112/g.49569 Transcript_15112/m.49569 type:complete len:222 (-) Transcript_15112:361-1026(-)
MPLWDVLHIPHVLHQTRQQPRDEVRQLAHHPRRLISRFDEGDEIFHRHRARAIFESLVLSDLHEIIRNVSEVRLDEFRVVLRDLNQECESLLSLVLLVRRESGVERGNHARQQVPKPGLDVFIFDAEHKRGGRLERCDAHRKRTPFRNVILEHTMQHRHVRHQSSDNLLVLRELCENVQRPFTKLVGPLAHALEHEREQLRPRGRLQNAPGELADDVPNLA